MDHGSAPPTDIHRLDVGEVSNPYASCTGGLEESLPEKKKRMLLKKRKDSPQFYSSNTHQESAATSVGHVDGKGELDNRWIHPRFLYTPACRTCG